MGDPTGIWEMGLHCSRLVGGKKDFSGNFKLAASY